MDIVCTSTYVCRADGIFIMHQNTKTCKNVLQYIWKSNVFLLLQALKKTMYYMHTEYDGRVFFNLKDKNTDIIFEIQEK